MNKLLIVIAILIVAVAGVMILRKPTTSPSESNVNRQPTTVLSQIVTSTTQTVQPSKVTTAVDTISTSELDAALQKELDQLDADIKAGSKSTLNDSDFDF